MSHNSQTRILKVISLLMNYPEREIWDFKDGLLEEIQRADLPGQSLQGGLTDFVEELTSQDLLDAQSVYCGMFDRGRNLSLLLFEHVHGESRDRGQAMVDLMEVYRKNGFEIQTRELPDFIPLFLEYLSFRPEREARDWLGEVAHILGTLLVRLRERDSSYAVLFKVLLALATNKVDMTDIEQAVANEEPDDTREAMDKIWEEEAVSFGGDAVSGGCPSQRTSPASSAGVDPNQPRPVKWVDVGAQASGGL